MTVKIDKGSCLADAIKITKEYCHGGSGPIPPETVLENVYEKLKTLTVDSETDD